MKIGTKVFGIFGFVVVFGVTGCPGGEGTSAPSTTRSAPPIEVIPTAPETPDIAENVEPNLEGSWSVKGWNPGVLKDKNPNRETKASYSGALKLVELGWEDGKKTCLLTWTIGRNTYTAQATFNTKTKMLDGDFEVPNGMVGKVSYKLEGTAKEKKLFGTWYMVRPDGVKSRKGYELLSLQ